MKNLINSALIVLCMLFSTGQTNAMLNKCMKVAGAGIAGSLCKKYLYDPLKTQRKHKEHLAPPNIQKLSDQLLDAHLKTHGGGIKKKLLVKYLKMFGYNRVYLISSNNLFSAILHPKLAQLVPNKACGLFHYKSGIFIRTDHTKNKNALTSTLGHETAHQYGGDATRLKTKFLFFYNTPMLIKNILKEKSFKMGIKKSVYEFFLKNGPMEFRTCKTNVKTLFYSGYFDPLFHLAKNIGPDPTPYNVGRSIGFKEIITENPDHPLVINYEAATNATNKKNEAAYDLEKVNVLREKMNTKTKKKNQSMDEIRNYFQARLNECQTNLEQAAKNLEATAKQMDIKTPKVRKQTSKT